MPHSYGIRARTRHMFARNFREHGMPIKLSTYLKTYKVGDIVDIKANGAIHKGMPHKFYHGRTGIIYNVTKSAVGIIINKKVGNRFLEKRVNIRVEHIKHSKCRDDFLRRVKENAAAKIQAKKDGVKVNLKRQPVQPREARFVTIKHNAPTTLNPIPYDTAADCVAPCVVKTFLDWVLKKLKEDEDVQHETTADMSFTGQIDHLLDLAT
ncbi:hypothetical protein BGZ94_010246, partial [Podila epigama]